MVLLLSEQINKVFANITDRIKRGEFFGLMLSKKLKITQPLFEALKGAHLLFYSHEPANKMTYDCWLDTR